MKTLMGLAGLTMAGFMLLSCNTEVKEANYQIIPLPQEISVMDQAAPFILSNGTKIMYELWHCERSFCRATSV